MGAILVLAMPGAISASPADSAAGCAFSVNQPTVARGDNLTLMVTKGPSERAEGVASLLQSGHSAAIEGSAYLPADGSASAQITGAIAPTLEYGSYLIGVKIGAISCVPSDPKQRLRVAPPGDPEIQLSEFDPPSSDQSRIVSLEVPGSAGSPPSLRKIRVARLVLHGSGFQANPADDVLYINSVRQSVVAGDCPAAARQHGPVGRQIVAQVVNDQEIDLCRVPVPADGKLGVRLTLGDRRSEQRTFYVYNHGETTVAPMAGTIALVLALLPLLLLSGLKDSYTISRQDYKLRLLFLDPQTNSYPIPRAARRHGSHLPLELRPAALNPAVVDDGGAQRIANSQSLCVAAGGREIPAVKALILGQAHHEIVRGGELEQGLEILVTIERKILGLEARQVDSKPRGIFGAGLLAVHIEQFEQYARAQCGLAAAVGQVAAVAFEHGDTRVVAPNAPRLEHIDDGARRRLLDIVHDAVPDFWPSPGAGVN